ncbi:MAG: beta-ketoacyl-ACP synthase II [Chloroflexota bacterium]
MARRVVVTGLGAITPVGNDVPTTWSALVAGKSGVARITQFDPSPFSVQIAGEVKNFNPTDFLEPSEARRMDRCVQFAVVAAMEALKDANLQVTEDNAERFGALVGSSVGGIKTLLENQRILEERGPRRVGPWFLPMMVPDTSAGQIAITLGVRGPNMCISTSCATGGNAIGEAWEIVRRGDADIMFAGGTESAVVPVSLAGFIQAKALATNNEQPEKAMCPWDKKRNGFVMSEGSAILILEELEHARARGAKIYAEMLGYGATADAFHLIAPPEGAEGAGRAMRAALRKAGIHPEEVDYVNAHGSSTPLNDVAETICLKNVFGKHAYKLLVASTKSITGHMMGAAGAIEAISTIMSICHGVVAPTINLDDPDPECDLDYVPNVARKAEVNIGLSSSMGMGGHNSCVIFGKYPDVRGA